MTSYAASTARAEMSELRRLKSLLPPELQSWVLIEVATAVNPPLITCEEIGRERNLLFWHEVGRVQADSIPRDGWEMAALAIGLGGAVGELWVQDGLLLVLAMGLSGVAGWRLFQKNNGEKASLEDIEADERAIQLATRFGYSLPNAYKSLGSALKMLVEDTPKKNLRRRYELRLSALKKSAAKAKAKSQGAGQQEVYDY
jgi:Protein of unknown function (DUF3318)